MCVYVCVCVCARARMCACVCASMRAFFFLCVCVFVSHVQTVMVGDDIENDVGGAQKCGMRGVLVRTGKYRYVCISCDFFQPCSWSFSLAPHGNGTPYLDPRIR